MKTIVLEDFIVELDEEVRIGDEKALIAVEFKGAAIKDEGNWANAVSKALFKVVVEEYLTTKKKISNPISKTAFAKYYNEYCGEKVLYSIDEINIYRVSQKQLDRPTAEEMEA